MSEFWMAAHSSIVLPFSHSVAYDELAIAEPHPNVCEQRAQPCVPCGGAVRFAGGCGRGRGDSGSGGRADAHLEHRVLDPAILDAHLQLHDVPACRGADQAGAHAGVVLVKRSNVARRLVVVDDVLVVRASRRARDKARGSRRPHGSSQARPQHG